MSKLEELIKEFCPNGVEYKRLSEVCEFNRGTSITSKDAQVGNIPVISGGQKPAFYHNVSNRPANTITVAGSGAYAGYVAIWDKPIFCADSFSVDIIDENRLNKRYLYHYLLSKQTQIYAKKQGAGIPHVHGKNIANLQIPLPALPIQREIVRILDGLTLYKDELKNKLNEELIVRRKQYEFYRDKLLQCGCFTKTETIGENIEWLKTGLNPRQNFKLNEQNANCFYITGKDIFNNRVNVTERTDKITQNTVLLINKRANLQDNILLFASTGTGTVGRMTVIDCYDFSWNVSETMYCIKPKGNRLLVKYLMYFLYSQTARSEFEPKISKGSVPHLKVTDLLNVHINLPPIDVQERIVKVLDNFDAICSDLGIGLPAEIEKRQKQYEYYREKLLTFDGKYATILTERNGTGRAD